mgnify:CR=1 FL=1
MQICLSGLGFQWFMTLGKLYSYPLFQGSTSRAMTQIYFGGQWSPGSCQLRSCRYASSRNWPPSSDFIRMEFMYPTSLQNYDQSPFTWASLGAPTHSISSASPLPSSFWFLPCVASLSLSSSSPFASWSGNLIWVMFGYIWSIFWFPVRSRPVRPLRSFWFWRCRSCFADSQAWCSWQLMRRRGRFHRGHRRDRWSWCCRRRWRRSYVCSCFYSECRPFHNWDDSSYQSWALSLSGRQILNPFRRTSWRAYTRNGSWYLLPSVWTHSRRTSSSLAFHFVGAGDRPTRWQLWYWSPLEAATSLSLLFVVPFVAHSEDLPHPHCPCQFFQTSLLTASSLRFSPL